jgi:hypothetical protein
MTTEKKIKCLTHFSFNEDSVLRRIKKDSNKTAHRKSDYSHKGSTDFV